MKWEAHAVAALRVSRAWLVRKDNAMNRRNKNRLRKTSMPKRSGSDGQGRGNAVEALERRLLLSTYTVNTLSDSANPGAGLLTLRQAVADANAHAGADTVVFGSGLFPTSALRTITLTRGQISLTDRSGSTTIAGPGAGKLAISGNSASRVFNIAAKVTATISNLAITRGPDDWSRGAGTG